MISFAEVKANPNIPAFTSGDTVKVTFKIVEGDKERNQVFQGVIIRVRRGGIGSSFTVRRVVYGIGVEHTFPLNSPLMEKVEVVRRGRKRRAKLYYLRGLSAKASRLRERRLTQQELERERERVQMLEEEQEKASEAEGKLEAELPQEETPDLEREEGAEAGGNS